MPLEIKELNIRVNISPAGEGTGDPARTDAPAAGSQNDKVIEACVEQVLEILKSKKER